MPNYEIKKRSGNGRWYIHWTEGGRSRRLSTGTVDLGEAQQVFAAFLTEGGKRGGIEDTPALTCAMAIDQYMEEHVEVKSLTANRMRSMARHLKSFFGDTPMKDVDVSLCREYADHRRSTGKARKGEEVANGTIGRELSMLRTASTHAVKWKRMSVADAPVMEMPETDPPRDRWLSQDELAALFAAAKEDGPEIHLFCLMAYYTASRRGALEALRWFQVDLDIRVINLQEPGRRRTKKRRAAVPIDSRLLPHLVEARKSATSERVLGDRVNQWYSFRRVADSIGLGDVTPHTLRHTRATHLLRDGRDPWAVAGLLGDSLKTVMETYGHHCPESIRSAIEGEEIGADSGAQ